MSSNKIQTRNMNFGINRPNSVGVMAARETRINVSVGTPKATGKTVNVNKNYPSQYNHAAKQWNYFNKSGLQNKRLMHGGSFLLYNKTVVFLAIISIIFAGLSLRWKYFVTIPVVISPIYMVLSAFNLHVRRINGSLFNYQMLAVPKNTLSSTNEFYDIPIHGNIQSQFLLGLVHNNAALFAHLRSEYSNSSVIEIMPYTPTYENYTKHTIGKALGHFFLFFLIFLFAIIMVSSTITD